MKKITSVYVITMTEEADCDYLRVFANIDDLVDGLMEDLEDSDVFTLNREDVKKHILEREAHGFDYLFFADEIDETVNKSANEFMVRKATIG
jgi:hypothetical protein